MLVRPTVSTLTNVDQCHETLNPLSSYSFGEIEYSVRQEIHTTSARFPV